MCRKNVPLDQYNKNKAKPDGLTISCRPCMVTYQAAHYQRNKKKMNDKAHVRSKRNLAYWRELKDNKPCADCKVVHRYFALDYDHLDSSLKVADVATLINTGQARAAVEAEIAKCDLVCATCHRYRTWKRKNIKEWAV